PRGKGRTVAGAALFVLGFSFVFSTEGYAVGGIGELLRSHDAGLTQVFGGITVLLGLLFAGLFDRFTFAGRIFRPSTRPQAGLAGAPLLGILFGFGWTPCIGPTLSAVLGMAGASGTAGRGAFLAFVYGLGLGIPFLIVAVAFQRVVNVLGFFRRNARLVSRLGGAFLVVVGLLELTGAWSSAVTWMHAHWFGSYTTPLLSPGSVPLALRRRDQRPYQPVVVALLRVPVHADREPAPGSLQGLHDVVTRCPAGERKAGPETTGGRGLMMGGGCRHLSSQQAAEGGFAAQLDIVRQVLGRVRAVPGKMLGQRPAGRRGHDLQSPANRQQRNVLLESGLHQGELESVPAPFGGIGFLVRGLPVQRGIQVAAAGEDQPVHRADQRADRVRRHWREHDRGAAGLLDGSGIAHRRHDRFPDPVAPVSSVEFAGDADNWAGAHVILP
ncbi:MAG TPA: cytochrome c biogenesis CcdA family protein, partial [Trebonia sp.]|nr:cytochrome c biogenesis CcdA family protein [Trebonia sp.]